jgi:hypothetical protein
VLAGSVIATGHRAVGTPAGNATADALDATWRAALDRALPAGYTVLVDEGFAWDAETATYRDVTTVTAPDGTVTTFVVRLSHTISPDVTRCDRQLTLLNCYPPTERDGGLYYEDGFKYGTTTWTTDVVGPLGIGPTAEVFISESAPTLARAALPFEALAALATEPGLRW